MAPKAISEGLKSKIFLGGHVPDVPLPLAHTLCALYSISHVHNGTPLFKILDPPLHPALPNRHLSTRTRRGNTKSCYHLPGSFQLPNLWHEVHRVDAFVDANHMLLANTVAKNPSLVPRPSLAPIFDRSGQLRTGNFFACVRRLSKGSRQEMGKIPNFTDSEQFNTPKMDCVLKFYQDKEFYQLGFQVC